METSFIAFGQDHTDGNALEAVKENLRLLHSTLKDQGKELVLAVEHAQEDIRTDPRKIAELHNEPGSCNRRKRKSWNSCQTGGLTGMAESPAW